MLYQHAGDAGSEPRHERGQLTDHHGTHAPSITAVRQHSVGYIVSKEDIRWTLYFLKVAGSKINILEGISTDKSYWYQISSRLIGRILMIFKKINTTASYRPSNSDIKTVDVNPRG